MPEFRKHLVIPLEIVYDPKNDQLLLLQNQRTCIYRRRRHTRQFVYFCCKHENTYPLNSMLPIGHWQESYYVLSYATQRLLLPVRENSSTTILATQDSTVPTLLASTLIQTLPTLPTQCTHGSKLLRKPMSLMFSPFVQSRFRFPSVYSALLRPRPLSRQKITFYVISYRFLHLTRSYLDAYFLIAEVFLVQNVDPG